MSMDIPRHTVLIISEGRAAECHKDRRTYGDDKRRDQQNDKEAVSERSDWKYTLESNKKEVYFKLTDLGKMLFEEHAKRHKRWEKRDMEFLSHYSTEDVKTVYQFMKEFNHYLEGQIEELS